MEAMLAEAYVFVNTIIEKLKKEKKSKIKLAK